MVWNEPESRRKYWATRSSVRSFTRTGHSFACSGLLAALTRLLARSLRSLPRSWESELLTSQNDLVLSHSAATSAFPRHHSSTIITDLYVGPKVIRQTCIFAINLPFAICTKKPLLLFLCKFRFRNERALFRGKY